MRKLLIPLLALSLCAALSTGRALAQQQQPPPPSADQVAASVQQFYDQLSAMRTRFYMTQVQRMSGHTSRGWGDLLVLKPGKMRFNFDDDARSDSRGQVLVSDGEHIQQYTPGNDGEAGQVIELSTHDSELVGPLSFLLGTGRLADQFTFRLLDARAQGYTAAGGYVLEMTPRPPSPHYERVLLYVRMFTVHDPSGPVRQSAAVERMLIVNHTGDRTRYDFQHPNFTDPHVRAEDFRYTPPAGTTRIAPGNR